jgi:biotin carboxyl carrier protein
MTIEPISEIRALLLQFEKSGLKDFYLRTGDWRVFMARPGGGANPIAQARILPAAAMEATAPQSIPVTAPHLGLFEPACSAGDRLAEGALVARIDVLGRKTDVRAGRAGTVSSVGFAANDLVEYGETLVVIAAA